MSSWEKLYKKNNSPFGRKARPEIKQILRYKRKGNVLDLGCGEGQNALFLSSKGFNVVGVDISKTAINRLSRRAKTNKLKIRCIQKSLTNYNINKDYEVITTNYSLHVLRRNQGLKIIREMKKHTKKSGVNVVSSFMAELPFYDKKAKGYFYLRKNELKKLYKDWKIRYYKEDITKTFATDEYGNPLKQKRVVMIAQRFIK